MSMGEGRIPFEPDLADVNPDTQIDGADADALASGVDPQELGLDDDAEPTDAERDPEATPE
ncbi:MAG: hypothetical protein ABI566_00500 [Pseudolysinimonas sp.]